MSAADGLTILLAPPPSIHVSLNIRNVTLLQADFTLTYMELNLYLPTSFCQSLLQGHILEIPDHDDPTGPSPFLTTPSSAGPENAQQREMQVQVLLSMDQDRLPKEEAGNPPDQQFHVVTTTREPRNNTRNFFGIGGILPHPRWDPQPSNGNTTSPY